MRPTAAPGFTHQDFWLGLLVGLVLGAMLVRWLA